MKRKRLSYRAGRRAAIKGSRISALGSIKRRKSNLGGSYL